MRLQRSQHPLSFERCHVDYPSFSFVVAIVFLCVSNDAYHLLPNPSPTRYRGISRVRGSFDILRPIDGWSRSRGRWSDAGNRNPALVRITTTTTTTYTTSTIRRAGMGDENSVVSEFDNYVQQTIPDWLKTQSALPFSCTECGKCCMREGGNVYMNRDEFTRAAQYLNTTIDDFIRTYSTNVLYERGGGGGGSASNTTATRTTKVVDDTNNEYKNDNSALPPRKVSWIRMTATTTRPDGTAPCPLLDVETNHCRIHPVKPVQCRAYPFYPSLLVSPEAWNAECRRPENETSDDDDDDDSTSLPPGPQRHRVVRG